MLRYVLAAVALLLWTPLAIAGATSKPDPVHGKDLAEKLCTNCHLVGSVQQQQPANADVPTFHEIANREGRPQAPSLRASCCPSIPCRRFPSPRPSLPTSSPTSSVSMMMLGRNCIDVDLRL